MSLKFAILNKTLQYLVAEFTLTIAPLNSKAPAPVNSEVIRLTILVVEYMLQEVF